MRTRIRRGRASFTADSTRGPAVCRAAVHHAAVTCAAKDLLGRVERDELALRAVGAVEAVAALDATGERDIELAVTGKRHLFRRRRDRERLHHAAAAAIDEEHVIGL